MGPKKLICNIDMGDSKCILLTVQRSNSIYKVPPKWYYQNDNVQEPFSYEISSDLKLVMEVRIALKPY